MRYLLGLTLCLSFTAFAAPVTGRYQAIVDSLHLLKKNNPGFAEVISIGENDEGTPILALRISAQPGATDPRKIGHLIVGTHHGNEGHAALLSVQLAEKILKRYAPPALFDSTIADIEWTIVPVLNISGYNANTRHERGIDPNRDYPGPCTSSPGGKLKSVRNLMALMKSRVFSGTLTVHGYIGSLTYPWGVNVPNSHSLDHNHFESITAKAAQVNGYRYGTSTDIVYPCDGSYEDYAYWKYGMWSLLLELRNGSPSDLAASTDAMMVYFDQLSSQPSTQNQLIGNCQRAGRLDLANE